MTTIRRTAAWLLALALTLGTPAALVLGTTTPAQACYFSPTTAERPLCGGGTDPTYSLTATPTTVAVGEPITLTLMRTDYPFQADDTADSTFSISSGTCAGNVCTPSSPGTVTVSGLYRYAVARTPVTATVSVLPAVHLVLGPVTATVTAGQPVTYTVSRATEDGATVGDVTAQATVTVDGAPCPGAVCTSTTPGDHLVTATAGTLNAQALLYVQAAPAASLVVTAQDHTIWNNASPVGFTVRAFDAYGNDLGDVTPQSSLSISPDGSCTNDVCTAAAAGPHTVTATFGSITGSTSLDASGPIPIVARSLPDGQAGVAYSQSVLAWSDASTFTELDPSSVLPPGLRLTSTGMLTGTPTAAGSWSFFVVAVNANGSENVGTTITIAPGALSSNPEVSISSTSVLEGNSGRKAVHLTASLTAASTAPVKVSWHTVKGTALPRQDYVYAHGTLTIPAGQTTAEITVYVIGDTKVEKDETFTVVLTSPRGATLGTARGVVTITNDD